MAYSTNTQSAVQLNQSKFNFGFGASYHIRTNPIWFIKAAKLKCSVTGIEKRKVAVTGERSVKLNNGLVLETVLLSLYAANFFSILAGTVTPAKFVLFVKT